MKWFKHDADASLDSKLQELLLDYGATGYGLYWYCVELIVKNIDKNNITFELEHDVRIIARNLNLTGAETKSMMMRMVELNLFGLSENKKITCKALIKRFDKSMTSSKDFRALIDKIKTKDDVISISHDIIDNNHDSIMTSADSVMNRTDKKRKEKKTTDKNESRVISPGEIVFLYKQNISSLNAKVKEMKSVNEMTINHGDSFNKIYIGITNYSKTIKDVDDKYIISLESFIKDKTYLDYQEAKKADKADLHTTVDGSIIDMSRFKG